MLDDLLAGAKTLSQSAPEARPALATRLLYEAHAAHHYMRRMGKPHPRWGNGSLMARALCGGFWQTDALCMASLAVMAQAIVRFRAENAQRGHGLSLRAGLW